MNGLEKIGQIFCWLIERVYPLDNSLRLAKLVLLGDLPICRTNYVSHVQKE
jgi:hypothetical protein